MINQGKPYYIRRCENLDCVIPFYQKRASEFRKCVRCREKRREELTKKNVQ